MRKVFLFGIGLAASGAMAPDVFGAVSASAVVNYQPGSAPSNFQNSGAALGEPAGDTGFGALTPFNPPFQSSDIVIIGAGGSLTLQLSAPVFAGSGPELGVFVNNGIIDVSDTGTGIAGNPAATFSAFPQANVSVSFDGLLFVPIGTGPTVFDKPTNVYTDTQISNYFAPLGTMKADVAKPFLGDLSDFDGLDYAQMLTLLDDSAGGTWLDVSATGLPVVRFVRFDVPEGASSRMVVDAVTAIPEPGALSALLLVVGATCLRRR